MFLAMIIVFGIGILAITLEDFFKINKGTIALLMSIVMWLILMLGSESLLVESHNAGFMTYSQTQANPELPLKEQAINYLSNKAFVFHLGNVAETLLFIMCLMLIVHIVDRYGGFVVVAEHLRTPNKRSLLWRICFTSFIFAALFDNLATAIVMIAILQKIVPNKIDQMKYAGMIIISANAGGAFSPIGDVTTLLLWSGGNISAIHQIARLFLPALSNLLIALAIAHFWLFKKGARLREEAPPHHDEFFDYIPFRARKTVFWIGVLSLALVPVFQTVTHLPPFMSILLGLVVIWGYTDHMYSHLKKSPGIEKLYVTHLFHHLDLATVFFFLGILMSVAALETGGQLHLLAGVLDETLHQPYLLSFVIGLLSPILDNVALVAATMGMYPIAETSSTLTPYMQYFVADGEFWMFLAYCAVTGGSILIIGSATGVTVMGLQNMSFGYYLKRFTLLALVGYLVGAGVFMLL